MSYLLGVDGGNTKTLALVASPDGAVLGRGRAACGDIYGAVSTDAALSAVEDAVMQALAMAGVQPADLAVGAFSMAGADWPEDFTFLHEAFQRRGFGARILVVNDALGGLRAGAPDGLGVAVVCGTGAGIAARAASGHIWHNSFWQEPQGGHQLAEKMLRAVYRADLGIDQPTALTGRVLQFFDRGTVEEVLHLFTARISERPHSMARLAPALLDEAQRGDLTARRIVLDHGAGLGDYALAVARKVGLEGTPFTLVLAGGVLRHPSTLLRDALVARVRTTSPHVRPTASRFEPVVGALFLALEAAGVTINTPLLERLIPTLPPTAFYAT